MLQIIVILSFFTSVLFSNTNITIDTDGKYDNFEVVYLKDRNSSFSIENISQKKFEKKTSNNFTLGYTKGTVWLKFHIENKSTDEHFVISLNESFYEIANLYYYDKKWIQKSNGLFTNIQERDIKTNNLSFDITLKPNEKQTFYLELKGKYAYFGNLKLFEKSYFYFHNTIGINSYYMFVLGVIMMIVLFNLFLYIKTKEKVYIYYVGYSFSNILYILNLSGLLVYVNLQKYIYDLQISAGFMVGFLVLFSYEYLEVKKHLPKLSKLFQSLSIPFFIFGILVVVSYQPWNKFINNFAGLICIFLIIVSTVIFFKGHYKTKYYVFAMVVYFVFVILFTFMVNGTLQYTTLTRYGFLFATVLEVIIFSFILATRYNDIKENIQHYLELEVENRTAKLKVLIRERELLLKEVYHRVKNNFHIVSGMLWFESKKSSKNSKTYTELINRIQSMSMIHEYLYNSKNLKDIDIKVYLGKIISNISQSYPNISIASKIEKCTIEFDNAISLGIIINETFTNALKHNKDNQNLSISLNIIKRKGIIYLTIEDNGVGFNITQQKQGLGLKLVTQFCNKLPNSYFEFIDNNGILFELQFKEEN